MGAKLCVFIDTRERTPLEFAGHEVRYTKLGYGDYSCHGLKNVFEIERKSVIDLVCTMVMKQRWEAWLRKCERWGRVTETYQAQRIVVVEGNYHYIYKLPPTIYANIGPRGVNLAVHRLHVTALMGVQVLWVGDRPTAARTILGLLGRELEARETGITVQDRLYRREPVLTVPSLAPSSN
jgi:ERCC4-type nuclease